MFASFFNVTLLNLIIIALINAANGASCTKEDPFKSGRFVKIRVIGEGAYATVYEIKSMENKLLAAKVMNRRDIEPFEQELRNVHAAGQHNNIIRIHSAFSYSDKLCMIMDLHAGGNLLTFIEAEQRLTMSTAAKMLKTMTSAVDHLHENNIAHLDIKLENFVFRTKKRDPSDLVLIDLGFSRHLTSGEMLYCNWGSVEYIPAYRLDGACTAHDLKLSDNYALGVILWSIVFGSMIELHDTMEFIDDEDLKDLLSSLISDEPTDILTTKQILDHPFMHNTKDVFATLDRRFPDPLPHLIAKKNTDSKRIRSISKPCSVM